MPRESRDSRELSRAEMCVLALISERPAHGWAISRLLEPGGEIGKIWSGDRQRVYRALRILEARKLIEPAGVEPGEGAHRTLYRATKLGTAELEPWLSAPADRAREMQSTFMLKFELGRRQGADPAPLISAQREILAVTIHRLAAGLPEQTNAEERLQLDLRVETNRLFLRFLDDLDRLYRPAGETAHERPKGTKAADDSTSDFSGTPIASDAERATIILRRGGDRVPIIVATAHAADPVVAEIERVGRLVVAAD
jgi:DNA-binding PadR family transcriptional regulator